MRKTKRFSAAFLAVVLALTLSVSGVADPGFNAGIEVTTETNKITVVIQDSSVLHDKQPTLSIQAGDAFADAVVLIDNTAAKVAYSYSNENVSFKVAKGGTYYIVNNAVLTESVAATCGTNGKNVYLYHDAEYVEIVAATNDHDFSDSSSRTCANCTEANPNYTPPSSPSSPARPARPTKPSTPSTPEEPKVETERVENEDGSVTETTTTTEKTKHEDGTAVDFKSTITTVTDAEGTVTTVTETTVEVELSDKATSGKSTVTLPIEAVEVSETSVTTVSVALPKITETVKVEIPVAEVSATTTIVLVHEDGTEEIVQKTALTEAGLAFSVSENVTIKVIDNAKEFDDVAESAWYNTSVGFVASRGILNGMGGSTFSPGTNMTRGQLAQMLYNLESKPETVTSGAFTDTDGAWFSEAVEWVASAGIVEGMGDGTYGGNLEMTREQFVTVLYRYAGKPACECSDKDFSDTGSVSTWAQDAMNWAISTGLIKGMDGKINPQGVATRAQTAEVLMRFINTVL